LISRTRCKIIQIRYSDPLFSASAVLDFDKNSNRYPDKEELKNISAIIKQSLAESDFSSQAMLAAKRGSLKENLHCLRRIALPRPPRTDQ